jgi:hypothetical protein
MESVFEILKLIIPAGAVFATAYFLIRTFLRQINMLR